ncbi:butyrophilin subfamily 3 member A2-like isoform X2 [Sparus aurata]|uniref:butyrophilin subfamily 3 member A2-like isoform X2 n=1 Tax=Sparus aurata TaxID=8175 RepID=UPI0011C121A1|nr:butyrophilin subfamily 3 member A2-like isoform X2 [Sparus aurata]
MIYRMSSQLSVFSAVAVLLLLPDSCGGQSAVIGPLQPIVASVGDDITLPCHLEPAVDAAAITFEWTRPDLNPRFVHVWRSGENLLDLQHPSFKGRTSLSEEILKSGDISLKLSKVKPSDEGKYRCFIPGWNKESFVELVVGKGSDGVVLQCKSTGWYPEPEMFWLDGEGNLLSAGPTETVRGPDDLYTVSSRVTVEKRHSNSFTCRVQQYRTNLTREALIHVQDNIFKAQYSSGTVIALAVFLALSLFTLLYLFLRKRYCRKKPQTTTTP